MDIKVHRGLEQIGGCITEISTVHLLECTVKGYDHISALLLAKY